MTELEKLNESLKKAGEALSGVSMQARVSSLEKGLKDKQCQINELQQHIDCLKADLAEAQDNKVELPNEPIKVATMLIDATGNYETNSLSRAFGAGDIGTYNLYSKSDLRQIAEHLLVYCNNAEDE